MDIDSKAKIMSKTSSKKLTADALTAYNDLYLKKGDYDGLILTTDGKSISLESKVQSNVKSIEALLGDATRFVILEVKGKLVIILWKPETSKPMEVMKYNSVRGALEQELGNLKAFTCTNKEELASVLG